MNKSRFQEDFPELAAGADDKSSKKEDESRELQHGPGPSLRPQSEIQLCAMLYTHTRTHARACVRMYTFDGPFSGTTRVIRYQKTKTDLDFTEARDSEWQWHQLGHKMQVCTSLQTDNHTPPLSFLQAGCPSRHPTNRVKALKACCNIMITSGQKNL